MSRIKLNIEVDSEIYEAIKKQYQDMSDLLKNKMNITSVEQFIENILISCAKSGEQMKHLGSKLNDVLEKLGGIGSFGDLDLDSILNPKPKPKEEKKPEPPKTTNLKS
ncbi:MAG: hypothetical protein LBJ97_02470 [Mycoplasmataceae bacterium]|jgi:hypothetical protein|nr:hypothetical protein [Mycoplasmataceae bacterium]